MADRSNPPKPPLETAPPLYLVPVAGPTIEPLELKPVATPQVLGRQEDCDLLMPADADKVSRRHVQFVRHHGRWIATDLNSRWGTFLNGRKLAAEKPEPLTEGDLLRIVPWTFAASSSPKRRPQMRSDDDAGQTMVRTIAPDAARPLQTDLLALLLEGASTLHGTTTERELGDALIDLAIRGTGLPNAALLRPVDTAGGVDVIAARFANTGADNSTGVSFSRSLLSVALDGQVAEIGGDTDNVSQSIVQMRINAALCVPLKLGDTVAALLYLDRRGGIATPRPQSGAFALALGRIASLALANLKRIDVERRAAVVEAELSAAAAAQQWILPKRQTQIGSISITGESRPGEYVGGDFFDVIDLGDNRVAIALGDVSGHGVAAGVLMTATQGYLHASLRQHTNAASAVSAVNAYVSPRRKGSTFVTAWVGVFDLTTNTLSYVDAGHSFALLRAADGSITQLSAGDGLPIGIMDDFTYTAETVPLPPAGRLLVVSDGILEQFDRTGEQFGLDRVKQLLIDHPVDIVAELFASVFAFGNVKQLNDDATAVLVKWD